MRMRRTLTRRDMAIGLGMEYLARRDATEIWRINSEGYREPAGPMSLEDATYLAELGMTNVAPWASTFKTGRKRR